jgi:hypothetical protein
LLLANQVNEPLPVAVNDAVCPQKIDTGFAVGAAGAPDTVTVVDAQPLLKKPFA